jgi:hypothetical protein
VDGQLARAYAFRNGLVMPWQREGVKSSLRQTTPTELEVTLELEKRILFKRRPQNHLTFHFEPGNLGQTRLVYDAFGNPRLWTQNYIFPWNVDLYLDGDIDGQSTVSVRLR